MFCALYDRSASHGVLVDHALQCLAALMRWPASRDRYAGAKPSCLDAGFELRAGAPRAAAGPRTQIGHGTGFVFCKALCLEPGFFADSKCKQQNGNERTRLHFLNFADGSGRKDDRWGLGWYY